MKLKAKKENTFKKIRLKQIEEKERDFYEPDPNNINKMCRLKVCEYADINYEDTGRIIGIIEDGYEIEFFKKFKNSTDNNYTEESRVIFGSAKDIILI